MVYNISAEDFKLLEFRTVQPPVGEASGSDESFSENGVLAIVNAARVNPLFIKFKDAMGQESYCEAAIPLGSTVSFGCDYMQPKWGAVTDEELSKLELCIATVEKCVVKLSPFSPVYYAEVELDLGGGIKEKGEIPYVPLDLSLEGKKIVVLPNLEQLTEFHPTVHVLCGVKTPSNSFWFPFQVTNQAIAAGTRAKLV